MSFFGDALGEVEGSGLDMGTETNMRFVRQGPGWCIGGRGALAMTARRYYKIELPHFAGRTHEHAIEAQFHLTKLNHELLFVCIPIQ